MALLKNPKHERFAQLVARGDLSATRAYIKCGYSKNGADVSASKLLGNARVSGRIQELQSESAQDCKLSKKQVLDFLAEVMTTPAGSVHKAHQLCQSFKDTDQANEIRMPDKLAAATQLAKMCGWNEPEKVDSKIEIVLRKL